MFPTLIVKPNVLLRETRQVRAALAARFPSDVQLLAAESRQLGHRGVGVLYLRQWRIEVFFVPADMIVATEAARGDLYQGAGFDGRTAALGAGPEGGLDLCGFDGGNFL